MATNEADIRARLELDGTQAVGTLRRLAQEIRGVLGDAQQLESRLQTALGGPTSVTGPGAKGLQAATSALRRGTDTTALINASVSGRQAAIRASVPMLTQALRKQDLQLHRAIAQPIITQRQEALKASEVFREQYNRSLNDFLNVVPDRRLQGVARTRYENQLKSLFNQQDRSIENIRKAQASRGGLNELLNVVPDNRLQGSARTRYEREIGRLFDERDKILADAQQNSARRIRELIGARPPGVLEGEARIRRQRDLERAFVQQDRSIADIRRAQASRGGLNELLNVLPDNRLQGPARTRYEREIGRLFDERDKILADAQQRSARRINELVGARPAPLEGEARIRRQRDLERVFPRQTQADIERAAIARFEATTAEFERRRGQPRATDEAIRRRGEETRRIRDETLFGDSGRGLFRIQARLLAHYAILSQIFGAYQFGVRFVVDFDRALHQLQAITATSNTNMAQLSENLRQVSRETKFTAVEVAEAATILGQAGFSPTEIQDSIRSITLLAAATGSTLKQSVDIATSTLGVFNLQATEMSSVADQITTSINRSKLNIEKLALGLQFAGNVAADAGLGLDELLASLAQFANAGVRSGSTLGTGIRQLIIDLSAPSKKLQNRYRELGLTINETNVQTQGFTGVLDNLQQAGFSGSDALEFLEVRAANAFSAITKGLPEIQEFRQQLILTNSAATANATQMESLANRWARFVSVMGEVVLTGTGPVTQAFKLIVSALTDVGIALADSGRAFTVLITLLSGLGIAAFASLLVRLTGLSGGLTSLFGLLKAGTLVLFGFTGAVVKLGAALKAASLALLTPGGIVGTVVLGGLAFLTDGFGLFSKSIEESATAQDRAQAAFEDTKGQVDSLRQSIESIDDTIERLSLREQRLNENQDELQTELIRTQERFKEFGGIVRSEAIQTVGDLIDKLTEFRGVLQQDVPTAIAAQEAAVRQVVAAREDEVRNRTFSEKDVRSFATSLGVTIPNLEDVITLSPERQRLLDRSKDPTLSRRLRQQEVRLIPPRQRGAFAANQLLLGLDADALTASDSPLNFRLVPSILRAATTANFFPQSISPDQINTAIKDANTVLRVLSTAEHSSGVRPEEVNSIRSALSVALPVLQRARDRNKAAQSDEIQLDSLSRQRRQAEILAAFPQGEATVNEFSRRVQANFASIQTDEINPQRQQDLLDDFTRNTDQQSEAFYTSLRGQFYDLVNARFGGETEADRQFFETRIGGPIRAVNQQVRRRTAQFAERSRENFRKEVSTRQKASTANLNSLRSALRRARTVPEGLAIIQHALRGVPQQLLDRAGVTDDVLSGSADPTASHLFSRFSGAIATDIEVGDERFAHVEGVGVPPIQRQQLRDSLTDRQVEGIRGAVDIYRQRRDRLLKIREAADEALGRLDRDRGDPTRIRNEIRDELAEGRQAGRDRLTFFDAANIGPRGLRGEERQEARARIQQASLERDEIPALEDAQIRQEALIEVLRDRLDVGRGLFDTQADYLRQLRETGGAEDDRKRATDVLNRTYKENEGTLSSLTAVQKDYSRTTRDLYTAQLQLAALRESRPDDVVPPELTFLQQIQGHLQEFIDSLRFNLGETIGEIGESFRGMVRGMLDVWIRGTGTMRDVFLSFVNKLLDIALNNLANQLTAIIFNSIQKGLTGAQDGGGGLGGFISAFFNSIFGPAPVAGGSDTSASSSVGAPLPGRELPLRSNRGGLIRGGIPGKDSVPALLTPGEFVLRASSARSIGYDTLHSLNQMGSRALESVPQGATAGTFTGSQPTQVNVWVVTPDQVPPPSRSDIITTIGEDIQQNGSIKKLIRSVQTGQV